MKAILSLLAVIFLWNVPGYGESLPPVHGMTSPPAVKTFLKRNYGYFLGDRVKVSYSVSLPIDEYLDIDSLPKTNETLGGWAEIKRVKVRNITDRHAHVYLLSFVYQVFPSTDGSHGKSIPRIKFLYGPKEEPSLYSSDLPPSAPVLISSLTKDGTQFKPAISFSWKSPYQELARRVGIALLIGSGLILLSVFVSRKPPRDPSPFRVAMKDLSRENDPTAALLIFRHALNKKAGRAIFPHNLPVFFDAFPRIQKYEKEVQELVLLSDEASFNSKHKPLEHELIQRTKRTIENLGRSERWRSNGRGFFSSYRLF